MFIIIIMGTSMDSSFYIAECLSYVTMHDNTYAGHKGVLNGSVILNR